MTSRQRLLNALTGGPVDRAPVIIPGGMMAGTLAELLGDGAVGYPAMHTQARAMADYALLLRERTGIDNLGVPFCMTVEAEDLGAPVDLGTVVKEPRVTAYAAGDLDRVLELEPVASPRHAATLEAIGLLGGSDAPVLGNLTGPVSLLTSLADPDQVYRAMAKSPDAAMRAFEHVTAHIEAFAREQAAAGADIIVVADPSASGEILGEAMFRRFAAPMLARVLDAAKAEGVPAILHICGDILPVADVLGDLAWDALSVDSVVSLKRLQARFPGRALMGNVSTHLLAVADAHRTFRAAGRCVEVAAILSPACGVPTSTLSANIRAMVRAAEAAARRLGQDAPTTEADRA